MQDIACVTLQSKSDTEIHISVVTFTQVVRLLWPSVVRMQKPGSDGCKRWLLDYVITSSYRRVLNMYLIRLFFPPLK